MSESFIGALFNRRGRAPGLAGAESAAVIGFGAPGDG